MRPGARFTPPPSLRGLNSTLYVAQCQVFGEPAWGMSPWLTGGTNPLTQNAVGQLHCAGVGSQQNISAETPFEEGVVEFIGRVSGSTLTVVSITAPGPGLKIGQMVTQDSGTCYVDDYCTRSDLGNAKFRVRATPSTDPANWENVGSTTPPGTDRGTVSSEVNMIKLSPIGAASYISGGSGNTWTLSSPITAPTNRPLFARHKWANQDGKMAFGRVPDPVNPGRWAQITRVTQSDPDAGGQEGRKTMPRTEGSSRGEMASQDMLLIAWSMYVPQETLDMYKGSFYTADSPNNFGMSATLVYQNKCGQPIMHAIWLMSRGVESPNKPTPWLQLQPPEIPSNRFPTLMSSVPGGQWLHFVLLQQNGIMPWAPGQSYVNARFANGQTWAQMAHNGFCYSVIAGVTDDVTGKVSITAPTNTVTGSDEVQDGMTWRCLGPGPGASRLDPKTWIWIAVGDAAPQLVLNAYAETNWPWPDGGQGNSEKINTQWGWYTLRTPQLFDVYGAGDSGLIDQAGITSYPQTEWTRMENGVVVSQPEKILLWKDFTGAVPGLSNNYRSALPPSRLLNQWFDVLRSR